MRFTRPAVDTTSTPLTTILPSVVRVMLALPHRSTTSCCADSTIRCRSMRRSTEGAVTSPSRSPGAIRIPITTGMRSASAWQTNTSRPMLVGPRTTVVRARRGSLPSPPREIQGSPSGPSATRRARVDSRQVGERGLPRLVEFLEDRFFETELGFGFIVSIGVSYHKTVSHCETGLRSGYDPSEIGSEMAKCGTARPPVACDMIHSGAFCLLSTRPSRVLVP